MVYCWQFSEARNVSKLRCIEAKGSPGYYPPILSSIKIANMFKSHLAGDDRNDEDYDT